MTFVAATDVKGRWVLVEIVSFQLEVYVSMYDLLVDTRR